MTFMDNELIRAVSVIPPEFQINTYTTNDQEEVAIAFNGTDFLAVWQSDLQDGSPVSIFGQFFDRDLTPIGTEFQINSFTTNYQSAPAVASDGTNFLVAWYSRLPSTQICMTIIKDIALVIKDHPVDQTGDEYGDVQFSVTAYTRHGNLHYQWYKNGLMTGTDSNTYTISSLALSDNDATIYCVVSDDKSSIQSDSAQTYCISDSLKMMQQPASQTVYVGEPVTFSVNADSSAPLHYQWYQIISSVHNPIGTDNDTVTITNPQLADDHTQIYCEIWNYAKSMTSNTVYLTVLEPAFVVTISGDDTVDENSGSQYTAYADYGGGSVYDVTSSADWSASPTGYGHISSSGYLWTAGVDNDQTVTIRAEYNDGSETHDAYFEVLVDNIFQITGMNPLPDTLLHASPAYILINCNEDIKTDSVSTTTCKLIEAGNDGIFNTGDDQEMPVTPSVESSVNLMLSLGNFLLPNDQYLVQLSGITNTNDKYLDGEYLGSFPTGNGTHGGDFRAYIDISREFLSMTYNDNDTVSLTWKPFRSGLIYRIDYADSIDPPATWTPVSPISQWPITGTNWTGDLVTGIEQRFYRAVGFFTSIKSVNPNHANRGAGPLDVQFIGRSTQWYQNQTAVNFGNGITVTAIQVNSPTDMVVTISIDFLAKTGYRDITVRTGSYTEIKENGFHVD